MIGLQQEKTIYEYQKHFSEKWKIVSDPRKKNQNQMLAVEKHL